MIDYCPAVYLIYILLYVTIPCMHVSNNTLFRQRQKWIQSWEAESFNEASEVRTDYLQHYIQIFLIPFNID